MLAGLHWSLRLKSVLFDTFRSRHNKVWPSMSYLIARFLLISYRLVNDVYSDDKKNYCFPCQFDLIFYKKRFTVGCLRKDAGWRQDPECYGRDKVR